MKKPNVTVYDWPVRTFHWVFASLFASAFFIAKVFEDDSAQYPYHMMIGWTLAVVVLLRIVWGFIGTKYARFSSFELKPKDLITYAKSLLQKPGKTFIGHNPASSWAALVMMSCSLGLALSGTLMVHGQKEALEEVHELLAHLFLVSALAHIAGVIYHTIRHKDPIGLSMITGKKALGEPSAGIGQNFAAVAVLLLLITGLFGTYLLNNYDKTTMSLKAFGTTHQLGKIEKHDE